MDNTDLNFGNITTFVDSEFQALELKDKRLDLRAKKILKQLQFSLTSCIRRLFADPHDAHQAYHFF